MSERNLAAQPLSLNSSKFLAYALIGYLSRLRQHEKFPRLGRKSCLTPDACRSITTCGRCGPLNADAHELFGITPIFEAASKADMPEALRDVLLSLDEYEFIEGDELIDMHIERLIGYLASLPTNAVGVVRPIFKLFAPDEAR